MTDESNYYDQPGLWGGVAQDPRNRVRLEATASLVPSTCDRVVDVGAGDGALVQLLRRRYAFVVAVERSEAALQVVESPKVRASIDFLPFKDRAFDAVLACEVIEHLPVDVYGRAINEMIRASREHVIVTVPNSEDLRRGLVRCPSCRCVYHINRHLRSFDDETLERLNPALVTRRIAPIGDREPVPPRALTVLARRLGLLAPPHAGKPVCPQCGAAREVGAGRARRGSFVRRIVRATVTTTRRAPWLAAVYGRR